LCSFVGGPVLIFLRGEVHLKVYEKKTIICCDLQPNILLYRQRLSVKLCNYQFHSYVNSISPNELELKDTTEIFTCALYSGILLKLQREDFWIKNLDTAVLKDAVITLSM
jgi:hypothetical protein